MVNGSGDRPADGASVRIGIAGAVALNGWLLLALPVTAYAMAFSIAQNTVTPLSGLVVGGGLGAGLAYLLAPVGHRGEGIRIFALAFLFNAGAALAIYELLEQHYGVPYFKGGTDDWQFDTYGRTLWMHGVTGVREGASLLFGLSKYYGYPITLSWTYAVADLIGGAHSIAPRYLNVLAGSIMAVLMFRLALRLNYPPEAARWTGILVAVYPFFSFHHVLVLRDSLTALFVVGATTAFLEMWRDRRWWPQPILFVALMLALLTYRDSSAYLLVMALLAAYFVSPRGREEARRRLLLAGLVLVLLLPLAGSLLKLWYYAQRYQDAYLVMFGGVSGPNSAALKLLGLPFPLNLMSRFALGLVWPLPALASDPADMFRNSGALIWYPLLPFIGIGWQRGFAQPGRRPVAVVALLFMAGVVLVTLQYRHMVQYIPFLLMFGVGAYHEQAKLRLPAIAAFAAAITGGVGLYILLKVT